MLSNFGQRVSSSGLLEASKCLFNFSRVISTSFLRQTDKNGGNNENKDESSSGSVKDLLSEGGFEMPFSTDVSPQKVPHHHYKDWQKSKRIVTRDLPSLDLLQKEEITGTTGSSTFV